jgi:CTP:phosphocholine cytidylyltransferase-like protein
MPQENTLEEAIKNSENSLELFDIDDDLHERVDVSRNIYMPEKIIEKHLNKQLYKNNPIKEIKNEFRFLYNKDKNIIDMIIISTHNYDLLKENNLPANDERFKRIIESFQNMENLDLIFFRGRYKMTGIPAELRRLGNWFSFKAENEPYILMKMVNMYLI